MTLVLKIGTQDYGPGAAAIVQELEIEPTGTSKIGVGKATLIKDSGGGYAINNKQQVQCYDWSGTAITAVYFGGFVGRRRTQRVPGSNLKVWGLDLVDYNILLKRLVSPPGVGFAIASGSSASQILAAVQGVQNGAGSSIEATVYVAELVPGYTMPAIDAGQTKAKTLEQILQLIFTNMVAHNSALAPGYFIAPDYNNRTAVWTGPFLNVFDTASPPTPTLTYSDAPGVGQRSILTDPGYTRTLDDSPQVDYRGSIWQVDGSVRIRQNPTAISQYPNPYDIDGAWKDVPLQDSTSTTSAQADARINAQVQSTAFPRETLEFSSDATPAPLPGSWVYVILGLEGFVAPGVVYQVAASKLRFLVIAGGGLLVRNDLTLGLPLLEQGDGVSGGNGPPVITVPPGAPTGLTLASNVYNWNTGQADLTWTWTAPSDPAVVGYELDVETPNPGPTYAHTIQGAANTSFIDHMNAGNTFSVTVRSFNAQGVFSTPSGAVTGTSASRPSPPTAPGTPTETDWYDEDRGNTAVNYIWSASTPGTGCTIDHYEVDVFTPNPGGAHYRHNAGPSLAYLDHMNSNQTASTVVRAYDNHGQVSPDSTAVVFTSAAPSVLLNGSFENPDPVDSSLPEHWVRTDIGGTVSTRVAGGVNGLWCLQQSISGSSQSANLHTNTFPGQATGRAHIRFAMRAFNITPLTVYLQGATNNVAINTTPPDTTTWHYYDIYVDVPAGGGPYYILFALVAATAVAVQIDDVHIEFTDGGGPQMPQYRIGNGTNGTIATLGAGTAFPSSPSAGDQFLRTDLKRAAVYDGTRWLSEEFPLGAWLYYPGASAGAEIAAAQEYAIAALRSDYALYLTRWELFGYVNGTSNVSNYWQVVLRTFSGLTTLATHSTSAWSATTWTRNSAITSFTQPSTSDYGLELNIVKNGTPGNLRFFFQLFGRLVLT